MVEKEFGGIDRRREKRIRTQLTIRFRELGKKDAPTHISVTRDLSANGLAFASPVVLDIGTELAVEFFIPSFDKAMELEARVCRVEELQKDTDYLIGIEFKDIPAKDRQALVRYVRLIDIDELLRLSVKKNASDVHLIANEPPYFRINGVLTSLSMGPLSPVDVKQITYSLMNQRQRETFDMMHELDMSYSIEGNRRFRVNVHIDKGNVEAALRLIPAEIKSPAQLGLPPVVEDMARKTRGLIIVTGPTGSGKSTTLAAMVDLINKEKKYMVVSIEDPIEYMHKHNKSIIKQREVGADTTSFASALKHVLRQDPNVILVGEIRDLESISMAITSAETGHLVLTTLHTPDTAQAINRIIDVYPPEQQKQVRGQIADCLEGVIAQILLPRYDGKGRVVATEVLTATPAVRNIIRTGKIEQLHLAMQTSAKEGMHTMDESLLDLVKRGLVDRNLAMSFAKEVEKF